MVDYSKLKKTVLIKRIKELEFRCLNLLKNINKQNEIYLTTLNKINCCCGNCKNFKTCEFYLQKKIDKICIFYEPKTTKE